MFKATGKIHYDPRHPDATRKGFQSWWLIVSTPESIPRYYRHWVEKELGLSLNRPLWLSHVTVSRGEVPTKPWNWRKHHDKVIEFVYSPEIKFSETYAWLTVESPQLEEIRVELGLRPLPRVKFHLTLGNRKNRTEKKERPQGMFTKVFPWERPEIVIPLAQRPR